MTSGESFFMAYEWLHDKRLSWSNRALLSKIYALTMKGSEEKRVSNKFFLEMGFTKREIENSWRVLQELGYISKRIDKINGNQSYVSFIQTDPIHERGIPSPQKVETLSTKGGDPIHERGSHHTVSNTNSNTKVYLSNTYSEHDKNTEPQKEKKKIVYPTTVEEVEILFNEHIKRWSVEKPEIKNINVKYESSRFLDYWTSENWKRKGKAVKSVKGTVATWIDNASRSLSCRPRKTPQTAQEIEEFAQGVKELVDKQFMAFHSKKDNIVDAKVLEVSDLDKFKNPFLEVKNEKR